MNKKKSLVKIALLSFIVFSIIGGIVTTIFLTTNRPLHSIYEKRAIIFQANLFPDYALEPDLFTDHLLWQQALQAKNYSVSTYYYSFQQIEQKDPLMILEQEAHQSKRLIVIFNCHGGFDPNDGNFYLDLDQSYSSQELLGPLAEAHELFIYASACQSGYFLDCLEVIPRDWIYVSVCNQSATNGLTEIGDSWVRIWHPLTETFITAFSSSGTIEEAYWDHLTLFSENKWFHYYEDEFPINAPVLRDGDGQHNWEA
ncbi:MAG: hypothetical protein GF308_11710 [Candidatus Heimdallarchaeota archaeon]|nr:hypothetical protein [Candidatus Heimdallarchaeota archaeon]